MEDNKPFEVPDNDFKGLMDFLDDNYGISKSKAVKKAKMEYGKVCERVLPNGRKFYIKVEHALKFKELYDELANNVVLAKTVMQHISEIQKNLDLLEVSNPNPNDIVNYNLPQQKISQIKNDKIERQATTVVAETFDPNMPNQNKLCNLCPFNKISDSVDTSKLIMETGITIDSKILGFLESVYGESDGFYQETEGQMCSFIIYAGTMFLTDKNKEPDLYKMIKDNKLL